MGFVLSSLCNEGHIETFFFPSEVILSSLSIHGKTAQAKAKAKNSGTREGLFTFIFSREIGSFGVNLDGR